MPEEEIPKDKEGNKLWVKRKELLTPKDELDITKLETYDCKNFDSASGLCKDYKNRPDICKNSGCINPNSSESIDEQFEKMKDKEFIKIKQ